MKKILNIVGPQGCGKSTLAETIAAFIGGATRLQNADKQGSPSANAGSYDSAVARVSSTLAFSL